MPVVFGPSEDTLSLIGMILSLWDPAANEKDKQTKNNFAVSIMAFNLSGPITGHLISDLPRYEQQPTK